MEMKNCAAIITGGASGMGAATARMLAKQGVKVALFDVNKEAAQKIAAEIDGFAVTCDVTQAESVESAAAEAQKQHGPARICINCAGIVHGRRMVSQQGPMPLDEFRKVIEINLLGTFNVMRIAAANMMPLPTLGESAERGVIINTASVAAYEGQIGQTAYSASKGGIVSLTLPAARELAQFGIRVMTIAPGLVDTPMFSKISPEARASLEAMVPFPKRLARPEEYAMLVQQIIENPMLNGEVIRLDGALRMQPK
ncbi:SDR family NAD(P)-dependent oxidoreductase [Aquicella lusitana]|uniref:NAD(P)-dependent dehydrogenase (Short-subunit alcohol dehydrogenase family) n=1 Tax=Aquicella lusitana TaxID=254246 RepID=A0A370GIZ7_9COXI|nr:SDR family NAD(P)-dependent oxidoreductase [Aquicella lusitana]RDI43758.1 NAD(P)-dependent dehydrogenase (short-subunit alcohol dehydrogenase family) [Aquicella lusitana]VVC74511.1 putative oxidoreductase [Aquicella lusitana]